MKIARVSLARRRATICVSHDLEGVRLAIGEQDIWLRPELAVKLADALVDAAENSRNE